MYVLVCESGIQNASRGVFVLWGNNVVMLSDPDNGSRYVCFFDMFLFYTTYTTFYHHIPNTL